MKVKVIRGDQRSFKLMEWRPRLGSRFRPFIPVRPFRHRASHRRKLKKIPGAKTGLDRRCQGKFTHRLPGITPRMRQWPLLSGWSLTTLWSKLVQTSY